MQHTELTPSTAKVCHRHQSLQHFTFTVVRMIRTHDQQSHDNSVHYYVNSESTDIESYLDNPQTRDAEPIILSSKVHLIGLYSEIPPTQMPGIHYFSSERNQIRISLGTDFIDIASRQVIRELFR